MRLMLPKNGEMGECLQASSNTRSDGGQKGEGRVFLRKVVQAVGVMIRMRTQTQDGAQFLLFNQTFGLLT